MPTNKNDAKLDYLPEEEEKIWFCFEVYPDCLKSGFIVWPVSKESLPKLQGVCVCVYIYIWCFFFSFFLFPLFPFFSSFFFLFSPFWGGGGN
jgi:hypothetical protein